MASLSSKQRNHVVLFAWKFVSVPLKCRYLGSLLKGVDIHINDISVTEKEGPAALAGMSSALYRMLQLGYNQASSLPNAKLHALARGGV